MVGRIPNGTLCHVGIPLKKKKAVMVKYLSGKHGELLPLKEVGLEQSVDWSILELCRDQLRFGTTL